ncbi:MAG: hypothetical protein RLZZ262_1388 [Bacteroidota bacterium]|jgi:hypothetical protein
MNKVEVVEACKAMLQNKLKQLQQEQSEVRAGASDQGKSTAGDKHETAMAMAQLEQEQNQQLQDQILKQLSIMQQPRWLEPSHSGGPGALISTDQGYFFIAIALGKIEVHSTTVMTLSMASPLGKQFENCSIGQQLKMGNTPLVVNGIE